MSLEPFDWNVVIVGYWNLAILTPAGIGKRLFHVEEGTNLRVQVSLDVLSPHRVQRSDGLTVIPDSNSLVIVPSSFSYCGLGHALEIGRQALESLPETPVFAAGINLRFHLTDPSYELTNSLCVGIDGRISDSDFIIKERRIRRSVQFESGTLNLGYYSNDKSPDSILLNYEKKSEDWKSLREWLSMPIEKIADTTSKVLKDVFDILYKGDSDDQK